MIYYIAIGWAIFMFCCIVMVLRAYGERNDALQRRLLSISNNFQKGYVLDDELSKPFSERFVKLVINPLVEKIKKCFFKKNKQGDLAKAQKNDKLKKSIYQAGLAIGVHEYQIIRVLVMFGLAFIAFMVAIVLRQSILYCLLAAFFGLYVGYVVLRFQLTRKITKRHKAMEKQLPEVLDLLSVNVEAGLGFEQAIAHVIENLEGPLVDELTITYREMSMGRTRRDALLLFGERCDMNEVKSFVGSVIQAGELGISIKNVLRSQAAAMRQSRRNKVEEKAQKISTKILLPMILFIFPVIFIILMGPAVVRIIQQFGA